MTTFWIQINLESPKSAILMTPSVEMRTFWGFKSRWMIDKECKNSIPHTNCNTMFWNYKGRVTWHVTRNLVVFTHRYHYTLHVTLTDRAKQCSCSSHLLGHLEGLGSPYCTIIGIIQWGFNSQFSNYRESFGKNIVSGMVLIEYDHVT